VGRQAGRRRPRDADLSDATKLTQKQRCVPTNLGAIGAIPAVHLAETDKAYEIASELPGTMSEKDVDVKFADGVLTIKGEKQEKERRKRRVIKCGSVASARSNAVFRCPGASSFLVAVAVR
jgi:HSP20 family molecular chaperone IbpA